MIIAGKYGEKLTKSGKNDTYYEMMHKKQREILWKLDKNTLESSYKQQLLIIKKQELRRTLVRFLIQ